MSCMFRGSRSTLVTSMVILRGRRSTSDVSCCVFFANRALSGLRQVVTTCKFRGRHGILWHVMKIDGSFARNIGFDVVDSEVTKCENLWKSFNKRSLWAFTLYTRHFALYTLNFALHTLHYMRFTHCTLLYTLHFTLHTPHFTLHTLHFALHSLHFTLRTLHLTFYTLHFALNALHFTLSTPHFTLYTPQSPLHTLHTTFPTQHSTFFTLHILQSTPFHIHQSTVHWYGNRGKCTRLFKYTICVTPTQPK